MTFKNTIESKVSKKVDKKSADKKVVLDDLKMLVRMLEGIGIDEFVSYLRSPRRILWLNFWAGVAKGFGIIVGMTIVVAVLVSLLSRLVDFPLIGQYFLELKNLLENVAPQLPYSNS